MFYVSSFVDLSQTWPKNISFPGSRKLRGNATGVAPPSIKKGNNCNCLNKPVARASFDVQPSRESSPQPDWQRELGSKVCTSKTHRGMVM